MLSGLGVVRYVWSLGRGALPAALEAAALAVHLQDVDVVGEPVPHSTESVVPKLKPRWNVHIAR